MLSSKVHTMLTAVFAVSCQFFSLAAEARSVKMMPAAENGQVRALVIGIDQYESRTMPTLKGARADAEDLRKALSGAGVTDLVILPRDAKSQEVSRRDVETEINRLIEQSKAGDLVFISFAGHGGQQPELVKGSEVDGMDEIFPLSSFDRVAAGIADRIVDDEIKTWLKAFNGKGVDVLLVADIPHGGGFTDVDPKADDLPRVTFLGAVNKFSKVPEVSIPGQATLRGALSYAVARLIDRGADGPVTRHELYGYTRQVTYQYSQTRQTIVTEPTGDPAKLDQVVFRLVVTGDAPATSAPK